MDLSENSLTEELVEQSEDFTLLNNIRKDGINTIILKCKDNEKNNSLESYVDSKEMLQNFLTIYLTSGNFSIENLNEKESYNIRNLEIIHDMLKNDFDILVKYIIQSNNVFTVDSLKNLLEIILYMCKSDEVYSLSIDEFVDIWIKLLNNLQFKQIVLENFWYGKNGREMENTAIGYIVKMYKHLKTSNKYWGKENKFLKLFNLFIKDFKNEFSLWITKLIDFNKNYSKTAYILDPTLDPDMTSLDFMLVTTELMLSLYYDSRINFRKSLSDLDEKLFENYETVCNDSDDSAQSFNFYSKIFLFINKLFECGFLPAIEKIKKNNKTIQQFKDLIELEKNSARWAGSMSMMKDIFISNINKKINKLNNENLNYTVVCDNSLYIKYLRFFLNDMSVTLLENKLYNEDVFKKFIETFTIILDFQKVQFKSTMFGDNSSNIIDLLLSIMENENEKTYIKIYALNFITYNNHIISDILVNTDLKMKYTLVEYIDILSDLYINIDNSGSNYYSKMMVRYKINEVISKYLVLYSKFNDNSFDDPTKIYWKDHLKTIFDNERWNNITHLVINDSNFYFEEITSYITKINDLLKRDSDYSTVILNEDRIQQYIISLNTYTLYLESTLGILDKFINLKPEYIHNSLNFTKIVSTFVFFTYSLLDGKNKHIYDFNFKKNKINFSWDIIIKDIHSFIVNNWEEKKKEIIRITPEIEHWYDSKNFIKLNEIVSNTEDNELLFKEITNQIEEHLVNIKNNNDVYDTPSEFCDPIMMTPIQNPVLLPESKIFMEKSVIISHLINDSTDPFNRTPLSKDKLEEFNNLEETKKLLMEFKMKYTKWKNEKNKKC